ncbi:MAG: hypothetical protein SNJ77_08265, partial [Cytophagales bacterium]
MIGGKMFVIYVWVIALIFFLKHSELKEYKNKTEFWASKYTMLFFFGLMLSLFSVFVVNNFAPEKSSKENYFLEHNIQQGDSVNLREELNRLDADFLNIDKHLIFLNAYYSQPEGFRQDLFLTQFYWDKTRFDDTNVVKMAKWGETLVKTLLYDLSEIDTLFLENEMSKMPLSNLAKGINRA